ncbi:MAG: hypothetical protein KDB88_09775, partial [Flavobacteriales bacterium]|nr:hypothetical protein [Flavobacteriales bacterium]
MKAAGSLVLVLLFAEQLAAQYPFTRSFVVQDGAQRAEATCLTLDPRGAFWIGGPHGLIRTDGERSDVLLSREQDRVTAVFADHQGTLVATGTGAIIQYLSHGVDTLLVDTALAVHAVAAIQRGPDGRVWLGTQGEGLWSFGTSGQERWTVASGLNDDHVNDLLLLPDGRMFVATDRGGCMMDAEGRILGKVRQEEGATDNLMLCAAQDERGLIWIGTDRGGVIRFDPNELPWKLTVMPDSDRSGRIEAVSVDRGIVWIGTDRNGLHVFDTNTGLGSYKPVLSEQDDRARVKDMVLDREGALWWCSGTEQLHRSDPMVLVASDHEGVDLTQITALCAEGRDRIRFAIGDRIYQHTTAFDDASRLSFLTLPIDRDVPIVGLEVDRDGALWAATLG